MSDLICKVLGQQNSGPLRRTARREKSQTDEQRGKRACALTARESISKDLKVWVSGAAQGSADCRRNWAAALVPQSSGIGTHPTSAESAVAARIAWCGGRYKAAHSAKREQGGNKTGIASLAHVNLSTMCARGSTGELQEHLDAVVSFAGAGQRRRMFRELDILTIKWATGDLAEECCFLLNTQLRSTSKKFGPFILGFLTEVCLAATFRRSARDKLQP